MRHVAQPLPGTRGLGNITEYVAKLSHPGEEAADYSPSPGHHRLWQVLEAPTLTLELTRAWPRTDGAHADRLLIWRIPCSLRDTVSCPPAPPQPPACSPFDIRGLLGYMSIWPETTFPVSLAGESGHTALLWTTGVPGRKSATSASRP